MRKTRWPFVNRALTGRATADMVARDDPTTRHSTCHRSRPLAVAVRRPHTRTCAAVFHRNVGTVFLLRHAGAVDVVYGGADCRRRAWLRGRGCWPHLRQLHHGRLHAGHSRRVHRRPHTRRTPRRADRRMDHRARPLCAGHPATRDVLHRPRAHCARNRTFQTQYLGAGRRALSTQRHAPRCWVLDLLHGHQRRRLLRASCDGVSRPKRVG